MCTLFDKKILRNVVVFAVCFVVMLTSAITVRGEELPERNQSNKYSDILGSYVTDYSIEQNSIKTICLAYGYDLSSCKIADESIVRIENLNYKYDEVKIRGLKEGTTTVTITSVDGDSVICNITVRSCFEELENSYVISIGEKIRIAASSYMESYTWKSDNHSIVRVVQSEGDYYYCATIEGVKKGTTNVTVANERGETKQIKVTVKTLDLKIEESNGTLINSITLKKGRDKDIYLSYGNTSLEDCTIKISDSNVVSVTNGNWVTSDNRGCIYVKGLDLGDATITITNKYGESATIKVKVYASIDYIYFEQEEYYLFMGEQVKLNYFMSPYNTNNTMVYEVTKLDGDGDIVVSDDGVVTPKGEGRFRVKVYGEETRDPAAECYVEVFEPYFMYDSYEVYKGSSLKLWLVGGRDDAKWTTSNPAVATVDNNGNVTGKSAGKATITANTGGFIVSEVITVVNPRMSKQSVKMYKNKSISLKVYGSKGAVKWSSSNKKVATVSNKGKVTSKAVGTAIITAKVAGKKYTCKVTVKGPELNVKSKGLYANQTYQLKLNGTKVKPKWKSSNPKIAKVSSKGKITAVKKGTVTITAKANGKAYKCKIKVYNNQKSFKVNKDIFEYEHGKPSIVLSKAYFSGGKLKVDLYVMNNSSYRAKKLNYINYKLYDNDRNVIAYQSFKNVKLNIGPYSYKKITLTYSSKNIKQKNVILNRGISTYGTYSYVY